MSRPRFRQSGPHSQNTSAGYRDAVTLEDAVLAAKRIKERKYRELQDKRGADEKAKITLSPSLDAWLKKDVPE